MQLTRIVVGGQHLGQPVVARDKGGKELVQAGAEHRVELRRPQHVAGFGHEIGEGRRSP
jgi:hypothetical protein